MQWTSLGRDRQIGMAKTEIPDRTSRRRPHHPTTIRAGSVAGTATGRCPWAAC